MRRYSVLLVVALSLATSVAQANSRYQSMPHQGSNGGNIPAHQHPLPAASFPSLPRSLSSPQPTTVALWPWPSSSVRSPSSPRHETLSTLSVVVRFIICVHDLEPTSTPSPGSNSSSSSDRPHLAIGTAAPVQPRGN